MTVGRNDPAFKDCHYTAGGRFGTTTYCKTTTPNFTIIYWLATVSHPNGNVPELDDIDENLDPGGNQIPDVIDRVAWSLEDAKAMYADWDYRSVPDHQKVWLRQPPCGGDGCATNYPGFGLELSIAPDTGRAIYVARHELFHLVQYRYATSIAFAGPAGTVIADDTAFWTEATAEWAARKVDLNSTEKDPDHQYQNLLRAFLGEPSLAIEKWESLDQGQRQYGVFILAANLEERFGADFLRLVWEERANGSPVDVAIRDVASAPPYSADYREILDDFARTVYLMDFADPDVNVWRTNLDTGETAGDTDSLGGPRPKRDRHDLTTGVTVTGTTTIEPGGFSVLELVPPAGTDGSLHIEISVPDDHFNPPEVHIRQLALDPYPTVCGDVMLEDGDLNFTQFAGESVTPLGPSSCRYAAYIFTNSDTMFSPGSRTVEWSARFELGATLIDPFDRRSATGWGSGPLGNWVSADSSFDPYLSVDGSKGIANQVAPGASGVVTTGVAPDFVDPTTDGPIELLFRVAQSIPATGSNNPLIDDAFRISGDLDLATTSAGVRVFNYPASQYQDWHVSVTDDRALNHYVPGTFTPTPYGDPVMVRLRVDQFGTYAKLWMASQPEPKAWTAFNANDDALPTGWAPSWIVLQPRQTPNGTGGQTFSVDEVVIVSGAEPPGG